MVVLDAQLGLRRQVVTQAEVEGGAGLVGGAIGRTGLTSQQTHAQSVTVVIRMRPAQAKVGKPVQLTRADMLNHAQRANAVPVDVADVGSRRHAAHAVAGKVGGIERRGVEDVHAAVVLQPETQLVGIDRHDGDAEHVGILERIAKRLGKAAFIAAAVADLGEGTGQFVDVRCPAEGHAVEGVVDQQGRRAAGARARVVLAQVGRGAVGGRAAADREPDAFVGNVVPRGVDAVDVQVVA